MKSNPYILVNEEGKFVASRPHQTVSGNLLYADKYSDLILLEIERQILELTYGSLKAESIEVETRGIR